MISGAHVIIYSQNADVDRALLKDVFKLAHVDVGGGWLIFALPPAEVAVHPSKKNDVHELYFMCKDIKALIKALTKKKVACSKIEAQPWGQLIHITLPGGGKLGIYEPRHASPKPKAKAKAKTKRKR